MLLVKARGPGKNIRRYRPYLRKKGYFRIPTQFFFDFSDFCYPPTPKIKKFLIRFINKDKVQFVCFNVVYNEFI